jgi:hypothetical protein
MMRTLAVGCLTPLLALLSFAVGWLAKDWQVGLIATLVTFGVGIVLMAVSLLWIRRITWPDVLAPVVFSIPWTLLLLPLKLVTADFIPGTFVVAAMFLSACLWMYKEERITREFLILPTLVFLYEMLPINIPGPIDDFLCLTGSAGSTVVGRIKALAVGRTRALSAQPSVSDGDPEVAADSQDSSERQA